MRETEPSAGTLYFILNIIYTMNSVEHTVLIMNKDMSQTLIEFLNRDSFFYCSSNLFNIGKTLVVFQYFSLT